MAYAKQVRVAFSARSPKLAEILLYGIFKWTYGVFDLVYRKYTQYSYCWLIQRFPSNSQTNYYN